MTDMKEWTKRAIEWHEMAESNFDAADRLTPAERAQLATGLSRSAAVIANLLSIEERWPAAPAVQVPDPAWAEQVVLVQDFVDFVKARNLK